MNTVPETVFDPVRITAQPQAIAGCVAPEYYAAEVEHIFRRVWLNLCHGSELPNPGDFLVKPVPTLGVEVILVRRDDGGINAFYNVCTHRGNKVVRTRDCGNARVFSCGFHGWTFDNAGALIAVPDEAQFAGLERCAHDLKPLATAQWQGFVFVHPQSPAPQPLEEWLAEVAQNLEGGPLTELVPTARFRAEVQVNWKVFSDAFCEGYHVATIHRRSIADAFISQENPYCHLAGMRLYRHHSMVSVRGGNPNHRPTPTEMLIGKFGGSSYGTGQEGGFDHLPAGLNPERVADWNFDIVNLFPNFAIHVGADFAYSYNFWPVAVDRTVWEVGIYQAPPQNWSQDVALNYMRILLRDTLREDVNTTEATQANLMSGVLESIALSRQEAVLSHRYQVVDTLLAEAGWRP